MSLPTEKSRPLPIRKGHRKSGKDISQRASSFSGLVIALNIQTKASAEAAGGVTASTESTLTAPSADISPRRNFTSGWCKGARRHIDAGSLGASPCRSPDTQTRGGVAATGKTTRNETGYMITGLHRPDKKMPFAGESEASRSGRSTESRRPSKSRRTPEPFNRSKPDMSLVGNTAKCHAPFSLCPNQPPHGLPAPCASLDTTSTPSAAGNANTTTGSASRPRNHCNSWFFPTLSPSHGCPNSSGAASNISGLSDFTTTPSSKSRTLGFHGRLASPTRAGMARLQSGFGAATARPTGFGYAHCPLRYPTRRRESRIITEGNATVNCTAG